MRLAIAALLLATACGCYPVAAAPQVVWPHASPSAFLPADAALTMLYSPRPTPELAPGARPMGTLSPAAGRRYRYQAGASSFEVRVTAFADEQATCDRLADAGPRTGVVVPRFHGAYWLGEGPSPLALDANAYPVEDVVVPAGTFHASRVDAEGSVYWFCDGIEVLAWGKAEAIALQGFD